MKYFTKATICICLYIITAPLAFIAWLFDAISNKNQAFISVAQLISLIPGIAGQYLRASFYKIALTESHYDLSVGFCSYFSKRDVRAGRGVVIGSFSTIGKAHLADGVMISSRVSVLSGKHQHGSSKAQKSSDQLPSFTKVSIGKGSWIGENAVVMASLGDYTIVSAGSVVSKDIPDNTLAVGNPARFSKRETITNLTDPDGGRSLKVAHFRSANFIGGPEKQIISHLYQLKNNHEHIEPYLISFDEPGGELLKSYANKLGIDCLLLPASMKAISSIRKQLSDWISSQNIQVLCCHDYKTSFLGLSVADSCSIKTVGFSRGATSENWKVKIYMWLDHQLMRFVDAVVTVSESQADLLKSKNIKPKQSQTIENSVTSEAFFALDNVSSTDIRKELNLSDDSTLVFSAGRLSSEKGHKFLIEAFGKLSESTTNTHLLLAGDGPLREELEALAKLQSNHSNIHFLGHRSDIVNLFNQAQIMALPSLSEGLPNVVLEAMDFGCTVVASSVGGVPVIVTDEVSGLLTIPGDSTDLSTKLLRVIQDKGLRERLTSQAKEAIELNYSPKQQTEKLNSLYQELCAD